MFDIREQYIDNLFSKTFKKIKEYVPVSKSE